MSHSPRIGWLLAGSRNQASSRLHGFLIHEYLLETGFKSEIVYHPDNRMRADLPCEIPLSPFDVVIFQKLHGENTRATMRKAKARDIPIVLVDCDLPLKPQEARLASVVFCTSDILAAYYRSIGIANVRVLPEMFEASFAPLVTETKDLKCVWFGCMNASKREEVAWLKNLLDIYFPQYNLSIISNEEGDHKWELATVWSLLRLCDVALITGSDGLLSTYRSANRLVQALALGLPVIAHPIPSYVATVANQKIACLCRTQEEWIGALQAMENVETRRDMAIAGYKYVQKHFSRPIVGKQWEAAIRNALCLER